MHDGPTVPFLALGLWHDGAGLPGVHPRRPAAETAARRVCAAGCQAGGRREVSVVTYCGGGGGGCDRGVVAGASGVAGRCDRCRTMGVELLIWTLASHACHYNHGWRETQLPVVGRVQTSMDLGRSSCATAKFWSKIASSKPENVSCREDCQILRIAGNKISRRSAFNNRNKIADFWFSISGHYVVLLVA